jgi:CheY-like chemotaxis protein
MEIENQISYKILLIEDDADDQWLFEDALKQVPGNHQLIIKSSCEQVLQNDQSDYDLIFLDNRMPGMNGKECLGQLKMHPRLSLLPVIIYTSNQRITDIDEYFELGAHYYLIKQTAKEKLVKLLQHILKISWKNFHPQATKELFVMNFAL